MYMSLDCLICRPVVMIFFRSSQYLLANTSHLLSIGATLGMATFSFDALLIKKLDMVISWFDELLRYVLSLMTLITGKKCVNKG